MQGNQYCTDMYIGMETLTFHIGLNTECTGHTGQFQAIPAGTEKSFFYIKFSII